MNDYEIFDVSDAPEVFGIDSLTVLIRRVPSVLMSDTAKEFANAVLVESGFAPRYYAEAIYSLLVDRSSAKAHVVHHNPTPAPSRERFLVELDLAVPEGWQFASSDRFELIRPIEHAAAE